MTTEIKEYTVTDAALAGLKAERDKAESERKVAQSIEDAQREMALIAAECERNLRAGEVRLAKECAAEILSLGQMETERKDLNQALDDYRNSAESLLSSAYERSKVEAHTIANCTLLDAAEMAHELLCELGAEGRIVTRALSAAIVRAQFADQNMLEIKE